MSSNKIKVRAALWVDGRQRQKVNYFHSSQDAEEWKEKTETLMQRLKLQQEIPFQIGRRSPSGTVYG